MNILRRIWIPLVIALLVMSANPCSAEIRIGFLRQTGSGELVKHNLAALEFGRTQGSVGALQPGASGGWTSADGQLHALEQYDVVWYHQGDNSAPQFDESANDDLLLYIKSGGCVLLSGAAGQILNVIGIERSGIRALGNAQELFLSGLIVPEKHRSHPIFEGLQTDKPILTTTAGTTALADFYGSAGPSGELLADGNAGLGERPLVEYTFGAGRVIFVGWRVPDFTTLKDPYRPNLERLFSNMIEYLAERNSNRAVLVAPGGKAAYTRVLGVPFIKAEAPVELTSPTVGKNYAAVLRSEKTSEQDIFTGDFYIQEIKLGTDPIKVTALGLTLLDGEKPASRFLSDLRSEQDMIESQDRKLMDGVQVISPKLVFQNGPIKASTKPDTDLSILLGRSPFMAPGDGLGDISPAYKPIERGGFTITGSSRKLMRPIVNGQNRVWTGDVPMFRMDTIAGNGCYSEDRVFPLWSRPDAAAGGVYPSMGVLRLGVAGADGNNLWLDDLKNVTAEYLPGYTSYTLADSSCGWKAKILIAPALDFHGMVCRVEFNKPVSIIWRYGGIYWSVSEANANKVEITGASVKITEANLPNGLVIAGWNGTGSGKAINDQYGQAAEFAASSPQKVYYICAAWGVTSVDENRLKTTLARLDTPATAKWAKERDHLKSIWQDCYVDRARNPEANFRKLMKSPQKELDISCKWWDRRGEEFKINTPDTYFDALINWERNVSEYHRQGPGLVLGAQYWMMYSHISTGWNGKQWAGDHQALEECLRLYGAMQADDGFIRWISPSMTAFNAEDNTPYWVDQVWRQYTWTGNKKFLRDMWPMVRGAVKWMIKNNDPDGDGLFRDYYEYWNCDSNGKGPKAATPSAMSWRMLTCAANIASVLGEKTAKQEYNLLAKKSELAIKRELWNGAEGRLGSIGADEIWRGHPQTWEEYLAINAGLLEPEEGRSAMRWLESHYGFEPNPGIKLLACSDWWPLRWSNQWVPTGDTCLAALAGMKCGDIDLWWPYVKTAVLSAFKSDSPGINMGISNFGAGGGDREDVDSVDPYMHAAVRGIFGIEPAIHEGRIDICPAFPSDWKKASIKTPDISYSYERKGNMATFKIHSGRPLIKHIRANLTGPEVVTPAEKDSVVRVKLGSGVTPPVVSPKPQVLAEQTDKANKTPIVKLSEDEIRQQMLFDFTGSYNRNLETMLKDNYVFDYQDYTSQIVGWWGNPAVSMPAAPRVLEAENGVRFLTSGRPIPGLGAAPNSLIALSSWKPYPVPAGIQIPVGIRCSQLWLLLQNYVHVLKNYVVNGEVLLHYADGSQLVEPLVPPYNLDCYFQHFSRKGFVVPFGGVSLGGGWSFIYTGNLLAHADALPIVCDPGKVLESVEIRATCSEGVIGLAGMTVQKAI